MNQESNAPQTAPNPQLEKRQTLWILLAMFFVAGWFSAIISEKSSYYPLYQLGFGLCSTIFIVRWVVIDAAQIRFKLTRGWFIFFVLFSLLAVPFYLIKTRGKKSLRPILVAFAMLVFYTISAGLGAGIATALDLATPEYKAALMSPHTPNKPGVKTPGAN